MASTGTSVGRSIIPSFAHLEDYREGFNRIDLSEKIDWKVYGSSDKMMTEVACETSLERKYCNKIDDSGVANS